MKKILLSIALCASVMMAKAQDPVTFVEDGLKYEVTDAVGLKVKVVDNYYASKDYVLVSEVTHEEATYQVTEVGDYAFTNCGITSVVIPDGIEVIGEQAFSGNGLTEVTIPGSVKTISVNAFRQNSQLASVTLNEGLESIGNYAFLNLSLLTTITLPSTLTTLDNAFMGCVGLTKVVSKIQTPTAISFDTFPSSVYNNSTLEVPAGTKTAYEAVDCWRRFQNIVESGTTTIDNTAVDAKAVKRVVNGQLLIERDGRIFNATGAEIK